MLPLFLLSTVYPFFSSQWLFQSSPVSAQVLEWTHLILDVQLFGRSSSDSGILGWVKQKPTWKVKGEEKVMISWVQPNWVGSQVNPKQNERDALAKLSSRYLTKPEGREGRLRNNPYWRCYCFLLKLSVMEPTPKYWRTKRKFNELSTCFACRKPEFDTQPLTVPEHC